MSWRALGSIFEALGLDFGALGLVFRAPGLIFRCLARSKLKHKSSRNFFDFLGCPCKNTSQIVAKIEDVISPCAFCNAVLHMQAYKAWGSPNIPAHKWGGGGGPPLGGINGIGS